MTARHPGEAEADLSGVRVVIANWRDPWHPEAGGAERYAWEMARALTARGAAVRFLTARAPGQTRGERRDGIDIVRRGGRFTVYPRALCWLLAHRRSADAVLDCQNGIPFFTPLVLRRRVPVLCVVHHVHTTQFTVHFPPWMAWAGRLLEGPVSRLVYRRQACVAVSPSTITAMRERLRWPGDIYLIPNGTPVPAAAEVAAAEVTAAAEVAAAAGADVARAAGRPGEPPRLVWIGRLVAHKRAELIVPVAARGFTIDVIGRGPGAAALSAAIGPVPGAAGKVRLHGYLAEEDKRAIVSRALLHLSTSQGEGWGLCVLEAAALGVPTVAYDVEGLRDAVRDGQTGWLVRDGEELADVVRAGGEGTRGPRPPRGGRRRLPGLGRAAELGTQHRQDGAAGRGLRAAGDLAGQPSRGLDRVVRRPRRRPRGGTGARRAARLRRRAGPARHAGRTPARPRERPGASRRRGAAVTATSLLRGPGTGASAGRYAAWRRGLPRLRLLACSAALAAVPFATAPGDIIADTKFELAVNPAGFLSGALTLWNPQQFGVLLNQAVGYLFPMGPFFEFFRLLGTAGWVVQRLWLSALLVTAFAGTVRLTARMSIGTPGTRLAAGVAYALSPAALSMLGQTSGEFLPMALAPWIIVPLTDMRPWLPGGDDGTRAKVAGSRARAVARSAVAVALCSGMNAASGLAVMVPAILYILTRPGARTRIRLFAWWVPAVVLVTSSWSVPLVLLSKYGVSIVPYTESAQVTSTTTSLLNILRGTESWIGYQTTNGQPDRPLAFLLATGVLPAVLAGLLAALGLAGLAHRGVPGGYGGVVPPGGRAGFRSGGFCCGRCSAAS